MQNDKPASQQIDVIIKKANGWQGRTLSELRVLIKEADPVVLEEVKWKKPSKPSGVPVWSHDGILCVADTLKHSVRLTFPKGAQINDPQQLFNSRLDSKAVRAIDFFEDTTIDGSALKGFILEAVGINTPKVRRK
jgi:hypothetical protein